MNLAPPSGPAATPNLPAPVTQPTLNQPGLSQPSISNAPAALPPPGASTAGQAVLSLTAKYGKDLPVITNGLVWRVFADKPDETGTFKLIREERGATPNIVLPPGNYVVHVALGLVSATRAQRIPTLKEQIRDLKLESASLGLLNYPVLQAADILMVRGEV